jgi:hypothetical protein
MHEAIRTLDWAGPLVHRWCPLFLRVRHFVRAALAHGEQGREMDFVHCNRMHFFPCLLEFQLTYTRSISARCSINVFESEFQRRALWLGWFVWRWASLESRFGNGKKEDVRFSKATSGRTQVNASEEQDGRAV